MGANVNSTLYDSTYQSAYTAFTNATSKIMQQNKGTAIIVQNVSVNIQGRMQCGGDFNITQDGKLTLQVLSQLDQQQFADISNSIVNDVSRDISTQLEQKNKDLNLLQANVSADVKRTINQMSTQITSAVTTTVSTTVSMDASTNQTVYLTIGQYGSLIVGKDCAIGQYASIDATATSVATQIAKMVVANSAMSKLADQMKTTVKQSNEGLSPLGLMLGFILIFFAVVALLWFGLKLVRAPITAATAVGKKIVGK